MLITNLNRFNKKYTMSNSDTIFAVVISGTPFEPEKWSFTEEERNQVVKRCHDEGYINSFLVSDNLKAMGAKPPNPHPKPEVLKKQETKEETEAPKPAVSDHATLIDAVIAAKKAVKKAKGETEKREALANLSAAKAALAASK